jgi:hypothetical protein
VLTDNGKQFNGQFTSLRPAEVQAGMHEHGITAKLTKPYPPIITGKMMPWPRREPRAAPGVDTWRIRWG